MGNSPFHKPRLGRTNIQQHAGVPTTFQPHLFFFFSLFLFLFLFLFSFFFTSFLFSILLHFLSDFCFEKKLKKRRKKVEKESRGKRKKRKEKKKPPLGLGGGEAKKKKQEGNGHPCSPLFFFETLNPLLSPQEVDVPLQHCWGPTNQMAKKTFGAQNVT